MTTASTLVNETRRLVGHRSRLNWLNGALTSSGTSVVLEQDVTGIDRGTVLSIGLERLYVKSVDTATKTATVSRGHDGTTAVAHATGVAVRVDDDLDDHTILAELNNELDALSADGLYQMKPKDITTVAGRYGYDLAGVTDPEQAYDLMWEGYSGNQWHLVTRWRVKPGMNPAEFSSGLALFVNGEVPSDRTMRLWYKAPFDRLTSLGEDIEAATGLHPQAHRILPYGAAGSLLLSREARRNALKSQGDSRKAEEVPPGATTGTARVLLARRNEMVAEEARRLRRKHPVRSR